MITISAFKWVPEFAQGQVRDLRVRWALEEAGLPYKTRLLESGDKDKPDYRALQPFGQVPILEEDGLVLFESGAIVLHIGERSEMPERTRTRDPVANRGAQFDRAVRYERRADRSLLRE
jgi:glutathione S-transferase